MAPRTSVETQSVPGGVGWRRAVAVYDHDIRLMTVELYDGEQLLATAAITVPITAAERPR